MANKCYACVMPDGTMSIIDVNGDVREPTFDEKTDEVVFPIHTVERRLRKTLFELSRNSLSDKRLHFDARVHTLEWLADAHTGHNPMVAVEIHRADVPVDRSNREHWRFINRSIVPNPS